MPAGMHPDVQREKDAAFLWWRKVGTGMKIQNSVVGKTRDKPDFGTALSAAEYTTGKHEIDFNVTRNPDAYVYVGFAVPSIDLDATWCRRDAKDQVWYYFGAGLTNALRNGWDDVVSKETGGPACKIPRMMSTDRVRAHLDMDAGELRFALFRPDEPGQWKEMPGKITGIAGPVCAAACMQDRCSVSLGESSKVAAKDLAKEPAPEEKAKRNKMDKWAHVQSKFLAGCALVRPTTICILCHLAGGCILLPVPPPNLNIRHAPARAAASVNYLKEGARWRELSELLARIHAHTDTSCAQCAAPIPAILSADARLNPMNSTARHPGDDVRKNRRVDNYPPAYVQLSHVSVQTNVDEQHSSTSAPGALPHALHANGSMPSSPDRGGNGLQLSLEGNAAPRTPLTHNLSQARPLSASSYTHTHTRNASSAAASAASTASAAPSALDLMVGSQSLAQLQWAKEQTCPLELKGALRELIGPSSERVHATGKGLGNAVNKRWTPSGKISHLLEETPGGDAVSPERYGGQDPSLQAQQNVQARRLRLSGADMTLTLAAAMSRGIGGGRAGGGGMGGVSGRRGIESGTHGIARSSYDEALIRHHQRRGGGGIRGDGGGGGNNPVTASNPIGYLSHHDTALDPAPVAAAKIMMALRQRGLQPCANAETQHTGVERLGVGAPRLECKSVSLAIPRTATAAERQEMVELLVERRRGHLGPGVSNMLLRSFSAGASEQGTQGNAPKRGSGGGGGGEGQVGDAGSGGHVRAPSADRTGNGVAAIQRHQRPPVLESAGSLSASGKPRQMYSHRQERKGSPTAVVLHPIVSHNLDARRWRNSGKMPATVIGQSTGKGGVGGTSRTVCQGRQPQVAKVAVEYSGPPRQTLVSR